MKTLKFFWISLNFKTSFLKNKCIISSKRGFFIAIMPFLIVLLLSLFSVVFASFYVIRFHHKSQHLCRKHVLKAQETMGASLKTLLFLNNSARSLNSSYRALESLQKISYLTLYPPFITSVKKAKRLIAYLKKALSAKQRMILFQGNSLANHHLNQFVIDFRHMTHKNDTLWFKEIRQLHSSSRFSPARLAVISTKKRSNDVPIYQTSKPFPQKQEVKAFWEFRFKSEEQGWLFSRLTIPYLRSQCAATLFNRRDTWIPILN